MTNPETLVIRQPDDWHVHLRDGEMLGCVLEYTASQFARAIVMPNLSPPVTDTRQAEAYRTRILAALPEGSAFQPLMTIYLTDHSDPDDIEAGFRSGKVTACKLYPAHATTNSSHGVTDMASIRAVLERMEAIGMPLLVHGEVTGRDVDIFDREAVFIDKVLQQTIRDFPGLKIVFEHITTAEAVDFVMSAGDRLAATITPHHLQLNRNAMFDGGLRPHAYCLPVVKRERHRLALRKAATSGSPRFFLGTDSAPHTAHAKQSACGCAGLFNAPYALESYATVFEEEGALDRLEAFASEHGPAFYGLPLNSGRVMLHRQEILVPDSIACPGGELVPYHAASRLGWSFAGPAG